VKTLTDKTRADNARFFASDDEVPRHVITQGIGSILDAHHVVLIATGTTKAIPIQRTVEGPVAAICPGSALQLHPHATVVVDSPCASRLSLADYYKATWSAKPPWQGV
jgi:glucosamine-6-phosphate deaminase